MFGVAVVVNMVANALQNFHLIMMLLMPVKMCSLSGTVQSICIFTHT